MFFFFFFLGGGDNISLLGMMFLGFDVPLIKLLLRNKWIVIHAVCRVLTRYL